jgi:hypothetical protein
MVIQLRRKMLEIDAPLKPSYIRMLRRSGHESVKGRVGLSKVNI